MHHQHHHAHRPHQADADCQPFAWAFRLNFVFTFINMLDGEFVNRKSQPFLAC